MQQSKPTVALTLGDPAGIGPELIAKLLGDPDTAQHANVVLIGDPWLWEAGQKVAGQKVATRPIASLSEARSAACGMPLFLAVDSVRPEQVETGKAGPAGGASC